MVMGFRRGVFLECLDCAYLWCVFFAVDRVFEVTRVYAPASTASKMPPDEVNANLTEANQERCDAQGQIYVGSIAGCRCSCKPLQRREGTRLSKDCHAGRMY